MPKRKRNLQETIDANIEKIKNIIIKKRDIYDNYSDKLKIHMLVIEKVKEKLITDVRPEDVNHFKNILRIHYGECFSSLHECSDTISKLDKEHYRLVGENGKLI